MELIIGSNNQGKINEMQEGIADLANVTFVSYQNYIEALDVAETGATYFENAYLKAFSYAKELKRPVLGDDGGLELTSFPELLGLKTARFFEKNSSDSQKNQKLLSLFADKPTLERTMYLKATLVYALPTGEYISEEASLKGSLAQKETGALGYGFDRIFYLEEINKTLAELPEQERNQYSPRIRALKEIIRKLKE